MIIKTDDCSACQDSHIDPHSTYKPAFVPTYLPTTYIDVHLHDPACMPTYLHSCLHAYMPTCLPAYRQILTDIPRHVINIHAYMHLAVHRFGNEDDMYGRQLSICIVALLGLVIRNAGVQLVFPSGTDGELDSSSPLFWIQRRGPKMKLTIISPA